MDYAVEGNTKRYLGNKFCTYPDFTPNENDLYQYGCEFEFYINIDGYTYDGAIAALTRDVHTLTYADILVDEISIPQANDKNHCIQIKPDISLQDHGIEISIPISTKEGVVHFIETVTPLIEKYGYTNADTGFHIHISTLKNDGTHIDFYRFMLLCDNAGLLSSWSTRDGYSQNVMDILSSHTKQQARAIKTKKGTIWNLERIGPQHIEIKSIGGLDYHKEFERIIHEFEAYADYFQESIFKATEAHKKLFEKHREKLASLKKETKGRLASALVESGILASRTKG